MSFARRHIGWWLVVATWLVYTWPLWRETGNSFCGDIALLDLPLRVYGARALRAGWFPTWTEDLAGGMPFFAESNPGMAYPLFLIFVWRPEPKTMDWFLALHYLILGVGMYLLARQNGARPISAAMAACLFMTSWGIRFTHSVPSVVTSWAWQPLSLWLLGAYRNGQRWAIWPFVLSVGIAILAGVPPVVLGTLPLCAGYWLFLCRGVGWREWTRGAMVCALLPLCLAAVQIVPLYGFFRQTNRPGETLQDFAAGTGPPWFIFAPWGFGPPEPQKLEESLRTAWPSHVVYGATFLALSAASWAFWKRPETWYWLGAVALLASVALESPLLNVVHAIPPFSWFGFVGAYLYGAITCMFVLVGMGFSRLETWWCSRPTSGRVKRWGLIAVVGIVLTAAASSGDFRRYLSDGPFYAEFNAEFAADLATWKQQSSHVRLLGPDGPPALKTSLGFWSESAWRQRVAAMAPDYNLIHGVPSINHYRQFSKTVTNARSLEFGQLLLRREPNAFRAAAVTHASLEGPNPPAGYDRIASGSGFFYRSDEPRPPAWMVFDMAYEADGATRCARLAGQDFDPYRTALVETFSIQLDPQPALPAKVEMIPDLKGHKEFQVNTAAQGLLVMSYTYYTQLEATIDGAPATVLPVNHAFCGVVVPAGNHRVSLRYNAWEIHLGLAISAVSLALVLWQIVRHVRLPRSETVA